MENCIEVRFGDVQWADMCKAFLQEAKWSYNKQTPTFEDYFENGWRSVSGLLFLVHCYFLVSPTITKEARESLDKQNQLMTWPSVIFRLLNDLATSTVINNSLILTHFWVLYVSMFQIHVCIVKTGGDREG